VREYNTCRQAEPYRKGLSRQTQSHVPILTSAGADADMARVVVGLQLHAVLSLVHTGAA